MNFETLNTLNEQIYRAAVMMLEGIALILGLASVLLIVSCLICLAGGCFAQMRPTTRRQIMPVPQVPEPDAYDLLAVLTGLEDGSEERLTNQVMR